VHPDQTTYTTEHFERIYELAEKLIADGNAYVDGTTQEVMREEGMLGTESKDRNNTMERNRELFALIEEGIGGGIRNQRYWHNSKD